MDIVGRTHRGLVRENNEDCFAVDERLQALVLADGMGGLNAGEHASAETVRTILQSLRLSQPLTLDDLERAIHEANKRVWTLSREVPSLANMGTTVIVCVRQGDHALVGHVGDSRLYRFRDGKLQAMTADHSLVQQLVDEGIIDPADAHTAPNRNIITRAVGIEARVSVDLCQIDLAAGDVLLLCSDGLSDMLDDPALERLVAAQSDDLALLGSSLVDSANSRGGFDNISLLLARVTDD